MNSFRVGVDVVCRRIAMFLTLGTRLSDVIYGNSSALCFKLANSVTSDTSLNSKATDLSCLCNGKLE